MRTHLSPAAFILITGICAGLFGCSNESGTEGGIRPPAPVETAPVETGSIRAVRTFGGALEPRAAFMVSPKIGGRLEEVLVDIGDSVDRGAVAARLDDDEYRQDLVQAEAELLVARANLAEAESALEIAQRAMERTRTLSTRGVASDAELDAARSELLAREAGVEVQKAQITRAEAAVEAARIRLGYTEVVAQWADDDPSRVVAERFIDEGQTVGANTPLLEIVDLDPLLGVFYVTEKDYANLQAGQQVQVFTDAYPDETFSGRIERIAPVFHQNSRQARVEIIVPNSDLRLKPGMFIRADVEVRRVDNAVIVPAESIVTRSDSQGVFMVAPDGTHAMWRTIETGIREGERVQVIGGTDLDGRVITLGQQLIEDGSAINVVDNEWAESAGETP
ncbi:efflux RND transporter periplasmic adaptor subunit [Pontiella agarivorans]|uniref:Efflux RND transporter periplasmic adaptor subunit n=1 Tax=Pontiella agarivorans TaxID=3038953 RepID=A0ABU5MX78_9BACT|nr:efflux RND transporter periplasmic adaptor subunit [Pontiella agarivorans]MDZ8118738.1 efflux RND transporter periplasmic adaptor subunit [Pontiella agarivorans]